MAKTKDEKDRSATQPAVSAAELDAIGAKFTRKEAWHKPQRAVEPVVVFDDSPANDIGHVPDPPFHGKHHLSVGVDFANAEGGETRIEPGIIDGTDLPIDVAESLAAGGHLRKV